MQCLDGEGTHISYDKKLSHPLAQNFGEILMGIVVLPGEPYMKSCSESHWNHKNVFIFFRGGFAGGFFPDVRGLGPGLAPGPARTRTESQDTG